MKKEKWMLLKNALRYYVFFTVFIFGVGILVKQYFFHVKIDQEVITDSLFSSLFTGIIFVFVFRAQWNGKDKDSMFNSPGDKT
jgi:hypothetical protein